MAETFDQLTGHEYDGIQEYDNPTPGWWHAIFFATVFFSLFYGLYWDLNPDSGTIYTRLERDKVAEFRRLFAGLEPLQPDEPTMLRMMKDAKWMAVGESVFKGNCVACHGVNAQGVVGPNLTDDAWKNVKRLGDIPNVIANGAAGGAMPSWKTRLEPNELVLVASYVASLRGKNAAGRGPEGDVIPPWPPAPAPGAAPAPAPKGK